MKAFSFEGSGSEYFKIWIVNILLTIVTLGLYYPWAKVRNNRYLYANSTIEGRGFDYHATGKQLFFGYLIAMALLIAYIIIQNISPIGSLVVILIFFLAFPWIIWRSLSFNMRMTSFSNVRFSFDGTLGGAYANFMLRPIAVFIVVYLVPIAVVGILAGLLSSILAAVPSVILGLLGLIAVIADVYSVVYCLSYIKERNTSYMLNGYKYGQGQFRTNIEIGPFVAIKFKSIALGFLLYLGLVITAGVLGAVVVGIDELSLLLENLDSMEESDLTAETVGMLVFILGPVYLGLIIVGLLVYAYSYARQRKYILANSMLDEKISFDSTLKARQFAWILISNFIMVILTLGLAMPWTKVRMARYVLENSLVDTSVGLDTYLTQKQEEQSSLGEQLGDAFDVDVGVGF